MDIIPFSLIEQQSVSEHYSRHENDEDCFTEILKTPTLSRPAVPSVGKSSSNAQSRENKQYKCSICTRSFPSFQALGGHKSIHGNNRKRSRDEPTNIGEESQKWPRCLELFPTLSTSSDSDNSSSSSEKAAYECDICYKSFSTYHAFRGHKSCHVFVRNSRSLQLFPESPIQMTSTIYETGCASSHLKNIDLELRL